MRPHLASLVHDASRLGAETAVVTHRGNRSFRTSYEDLADLAGRFASELQQQGIHPGDRVILWGENSPEWIAAFFGCLLQGVLAVPLDAAGSVGFALRVIAEVHPRLIVADPQLSEALPKHLPKLALADLETTLPPNPDLTVRPEVHLDLPFQIVFTSGTTSEPKGVVHTHRNVLASLTPIESEIGRYRRYERPFHPLRFLHTLPFSHVFGQFMGMWIPPLLGAELHIPAAVDPARLIALTKRERISVLVAVPRVLELMRSHLLARFPEIESTLQVSAGIPAWKRWWCFRQVHSALGFKFWALICGGATLPADLEAFWNGLGFALIQGYGMTETAALVTLNHPFKVGKGTLGKALPGRDVKLSPEGEILVRGDMLAAGSWQSGHFQPRAQEWLATGDLAAQDASGDLRFLGRKGDLIVTAAGLNIYPQDLEHALLTQPGVQACAVVSCDGPLGPEPVAVVLTSRPEDELRRLLEAANASLAPFQQMRRILRWPDPVFPYTTTGKLLRRRIAEWADLQLSSPSAAGPGVGADTLLTVISRITHEPSPSADDSLRLTEDLHLDSLGRVQLQSTLEQRFGILLRDEQAAAVQTLGQLRALFGSPEATTQSPTQPTPAVLDRPQLQPERITYPHWPWSLPLQWLRSAFTELIAIPLVHLLAHPKVVHPRTPPPAGPMLLIANHVNAYDVPLVLSALPGPLRRHVAPAMSAQVLYDMRHGRNQGNVLFDLLARPAYWLIVALFNVFPLPQSAGFRASFAHAGEALDRGYSVLVFPEGRRSYTGELQPFRSGIGLLVEASRVPVLPIVLQGMGSAQRKDRWFRSKGLTVRVGSPLTFPPGTPPETITQQLEAAVRSLRPG